MAIHSQVAGLDKQAAWIRAVERSSIFENPTGGCLSRRGSPFLRSVPMKLLFFLAFLGAGIGVLGRCACVTARALSSLARRLHPLLRRCMACLKDTSVCRWSPQAAFITTPAEPN